MSNSFTNVAELSRFSLRLQPSLSRRLASNNPDEDMLEPHIFFILNPAILEPYNPASEYANHNIPDNVQFYDKQKFVAHLRNSTKEILKNDNFCLFELACSAMEDDNCQLLFDGEYVEYLSEDELICIIDNVESDGHQYLYDNNLHFEYMGSCMTEFGYWDHDPTAIQKNDIV